MKFTNDKVTSNIKKFNANFNKINNQFITSILDNIVIYCLCYENYYFFVNQISILNFCKRTATVNNLLLNLQSAIMKNRNNNIILDNLFNSSFYIKS